MFMYRGNCVTYQFHLDILLASLIVRDISIFTAHPPIRIATFRLAFIVQHMQMHFSIASPFTLFVCILLLVEADRFGVLSQPQLISHQ